MNARAVLGALLVGAGLAGSVARGQELPPPTVASPAQPPAVWDAPRNAAGLIDTTAPPPVAVPVANAAPSGGLSDWILYRKCDSCFGPLAAAPRPIHMELFTRGGPTVAIGGTKLGRDLQTGFELQFGGRALFFDPSQTRATTVEVAIVNYNNSSAGQQPADISILVPDSTATNGAKRVNFGQDAGVPPVTIRRYNRTLAGLGFGKELYLRGSAGDPGTRWRVGYDVGGRYGSAKMDLNEVRHRTDVVGAMYAALHTDAEIPCGACWFVTGIRFEWDHTWSDILQRATDVQDLALMLNLGIRY